MSGTGTGVGAAVGGLTVLLTTAYGVPGNAECQEGGGERRR
jgi:hypothetical protein